MADVLDYSSEIRRGKIHKLGMGESAYFDSASTLLGLGDNLKTTTPHKKHNGIIVK